MKNTSVWDFLNTIKIKAKANIASINNNSQKIEEYRQFIEGGIDASGLIDKLMHENKQLIIENTQLLNLHQNILSIGNMLKINTVSPVASESPADKIMFSNKECVELVLDNMLTIDEDNPCFCDEKVVDQIYNALIDQERYEECSALLRIKEKYKMHKL